MSRYLIQNPAGLLYTGNSVEVTYRVSPSDPTRNLERFLLTPQFTTLDVQQALHYDAPEDAAAILTHPDLANPDAFAGCDVLECEHDRDDVQSLRAPA